MARHHTRAFADQFLNDVGFILRSLARAPAFTTTVVATLAIGIGVAAAMFGLTAWVLIYDSPFPKGNELHLIGYKDTRIRPAEAGGGIRLARSLAAASPLQTTGR